MKSKELKQAQQLLEQYRQEKSDPYRPNYHIAPKVGLLNDPNGLIQYKGVYHCFYQWNPFACDHRQKYWGHYVSDDLVHWREVAPALAPDQEYDANGCYSGSAFVHNDSLYLFYTGNLKFGDNQQQRASRQCLAKSTNGIDFEKVAIVIDGSPEGYTAHFRDPKIWQDKGVWYAVLGGQTNDLQGRVLLYRSENLERWQFLGPITGSGIPPFADFGYMWECPDLFTLKDRQILLASPQGLAPQEMKYRNIYQSGYAIGHLDVENVHFITDSFEELDRGFEFYAPQSFETQDGRRVMLGWMGLPEENDQPTVESGWIHQMTLPRELTLVNNKLFQNPVRELAALRQSHLERHNVTFTGDLALDGMAGECYELRLRATNLQSIFSVKLRSNGQTHSVLLQIDPKEKTISLRIDNRSGSEDTLRQCRLEDLRDVDLVMYMDRSSIEIFINQGAEVFSARIFPDATSTGIYFESDAPCHLLSVDYYSLRCDRIIQ